mmetsp:Transcript_9475/g.15833  ORF Transcript_9475/g.15833 Transcript_9475/m.15833 type:complete len:326 (-) Transcript_9475:92-1069(-)
MVARTRGLMILHSCLSQLNQPYSVIHNGLNESYITGMECGDVTFALVSGFHATYGALFTDMDLTQIEDDARTLASLMKDFKVDRTHVQHCMLWQMIQNLMGHAEDPSKLTGEALDCDQVRAELDSKRDIFGKQLLHIYEFHLLAYFHRFFPLEEDIWSYHEFLVNSLRGHFLGNDGMFLAGMVAYKLYHRTSKRPFRKLARLCLKKLQTNAKAGSIVAYPISLCLEAEEIVIRDAKARKRRSQVQQMYDSAIASARQLGVLQWEAAFHERVFELLQTIYDDRLTASSYLREALDLYARWGAEAKVEHLEMAHGSLLSKVDSGYQG